LSQRCLRPYKLFNASTLRHFAKLNLCFTLLLCTNPQHCYSSKCFSITPPDYADRNLTMPSPCPVLLFLHIALLNPSVPLLHNTRVRHCSTHPCLGVANLHYSMPSPLSASPSQYNAVLCHY
jgi:hypothetical protein